MEVSSNSPGNDVIAGKFPELLEETDFDDGYISPEFSINEEMVEEVMRELYKEIACSESVTPSPWPAHGPACFAESCGAAVSETGSSVMAGVEFRGGGGGAAGGNSVGVGVVVVEKGCNCGGGGGREEMDGCDEVEFDDEWLEKVLGRFPLEEVEDFEDWVPLVCV